MCDRSCVCNEQNMCRTELCPCQGSDFCMNPFWRSRENDRDSEGDEDCQGSDFCMNPFSRSRENNRDSEGDEENDADQWSFHNNLALE